jgi:outer membrane protein, heavy metal efflux system
VARRDIILHPLANRLLVALLCIAPCACARYAPDPLSVSATPAGPAFVREYGASSAATLAIDLSAPLDDRAIASLAVMANPDLKALRVRTRVSDAQVFAAGLMPDPTISLGVDHLLSGADPVDALTSALGLDLNALRTRGAVVAKAQAERRQARTELVWTEWQTAGQARLQAVRIDALERKVRLTDASQMSTEKLLARYVAATRRGDVAADALQTARIAASDAGDVARQAQKDLAAARLELNRLLGLPPQTMLTIAPATPFNGMPDADGLFALASTERADLRALRDGYDAQEAALRKAVLDQFPSLDLTVNAGRDTGKNVTLGPAIGFTLPLWNRNRGGVAVETATRAALKAEYEARLFQTRAEIAAAISGLKVARAQFGAQQAGLDGATRFAAKSRKAATRGDLSDAAAQTAEQVARDRQMQSTQSAQDMAEQMIALELLTGMPREQWK